MKNVYLVFVLLLLGFFGKAQVNYSYHEIETQVLKEDKKAIITKHIVITNEDAELFWPLYEEYNEQMKALNDEYVVLLQDYTKKHGKLTFSEAMDIWENVMDIKGDLLKLERRYYRKMINTMSPVKVVTYFDLEREVKSKVDAVLMKQIPDLTIASN